MTDPRPSLPISAVMVRRRDGKAMANLAARGRRAIITAIAVIGVLAPVAAPAREATRGVLGEFIPEDVWLYANGVHTPSRDFLSPHWSRVHRALSTCGIGQEWKQLLAGSMNPDQKESFEAFWTKATELYHSVRWSDLTANEFAVAERFGGFVPDIFFLCRPEPATMDENIEGLGRIMEMLAGLDQEIVFSQSSRQGVSIWAMGVKKAPIGLFMLHKGDVLGFVAGHGAMQDVVDLMSGAAGAKSPIVRNARYLASLEQVPPPEYSVTFLDLDRLFTTLRSFPVMVFGDECEVEPATTIKKVMGSIIDHLHFMDYLIVTARMDGLKERTYLYAKAKPGCESKPMYRMIRDRKPVESFHRFVPVEAKGFAVSSFLDLSILYETILETISTDVPNGADICGRWEGVQERINFNVREDLLSWYSGEFISVTMPPKVQTSTCTDESVLLIRVKDPQLAAQKIAAAIKHAAEFMASRQPLVITEAKKVPAQGFQCVTIATMAMLIGNPCIGIWDEWLVVGTSEDAVVAVMDTAAGKSRSILDNPRFQAEGIVGKGPVHEASFTDLSAVGQELAAASFAMGFAAGMIPDHPEARPVKAIFNSITRLGPVLAEINFYSSMSSTSTFNEGAWHSSTVTTYKPPE